jgi:hypothetical protein
VHRVFHIFTASVDKVGDTVAHPAHCSPDAAEDTAIVTTVVTIVTATIITIVVVGITSHFKPP